MQRRISSFWAKLSHNTRILKNAVVGPNWFEYLATCQVIGRDEIVEKYHINTDGRLIEKFTG